MPTVKTTRCIAGVLGLGLVLACGGDAADEGPRAAAPERLEVAIEPESEPRSDPRWGDAVRGCADGSRPCPEGERCCAGVPYPEDGVCQRECTMRSDRALKERFAPVDPEAILAGLRGLPIAEWSYRDEDPAVRHLGPVAQDFRAAFGLGADPRSISSVDANGVVMASVQALAQRLERLRDANAELREENRLIRARLEQLERGIPGR
jgi:hypothetical protein